MDSSQYSVLHFDVYADNLTFPVLGHNPDLHNLKEWEISLFRGFGS